MRLRIWLAGSAAAVLLAAGGSASAALAATGHVTMKHATASAGAGGERGLFRVYAPYFETWTKDRIPVLAKKSGAKFLTLAFIQAAGKKGAAACTVTWDGVKKQPISAGRYIKQIAELRRHGGDVIPSFGGFSADNGGTEIADSCHSVAKVARAYEQVVKVYHVTRLDMDVEAKSLTNKAGIARRSAAIALAQRWAWRHGIHLSVQFTIGIEPSGLDQQNLGVVRSAVAHGVRVRAVNLMVFDYYLAKEPKPLHMGRLAIEAVTNAHRQLSAVFPRLPSAWVWHLEGLTMLPGIDDYPKKTEVTYSRDAAAMMRFARAHQMNFLSIWALQRDRGGCPGVIDSNSCSGIRQKNWAFSHLLEPYTLRFRR
jgi:Glycosyl hydrolases family 18